MPLRTRPTKPKRRTLISVVTMFKPRLSSESQDTPTITPTIIVIMTQPRMAGRRSGARRPEGGARFAHEKPQRISRVSRAGGGAENCGFLNRRFWEGKTGQILADSGTRLYQFCTSSRLRNGANRREM